MDKNQRENGTPVDIDDMSRRHEVAFNALMQAIGKMSVDTGVFDAHDGKHHRIDLLVNGVSVPFVEAIEEVFEWAKAHAMDEFRSEMAEAVLAAIRPLEDAAKTAEERTMEAVDEALKRVAKWEYGGP